MTKIFPKESLEPGKKTDPSCSSYLLFLDKKEEKIYADEKCL
jgi:hypothetical protein